MRKQGGVPTILFLIIQNTGDDDLCFFISRMEEYKWKKDKKR